MYQIINENIIYLVEENLSIPKDEKNNDYCEYLKWLEKGNIPEKYIPTKYIPVPKTEVSSKLNQSIERWKNG